MATDVLCKAAFGTNIRRLLQLALFVVACAVIRTSALAQEEMPEGMLGWWYYIGYDQRGYAADPVDACTKTAQNQMRTALTEMRPAREDGLGFDCKYPHFLAAGGEHWYGSTELFCKPGYVLRLPGVCVKRAEPPPPPTCSAGQPGESKGNPVILSSGAKVQSETDLAGTPLGTLRIGRTYRTLRQFGAGQSAGQTWSFSFDRVFIVQPGAVGGRPVSVRGTAGDGSYFSFVVNNSGKYESVFDKRATLEALSQSYDDWLLTGADGRADRFKNVNRKGFVLVSSHTSDGAAEHYTYDTNDRLRAISDDHGRKLEVNWGPSMVTSIVGPDGSAIYIYDALRITNGLVPVPGTERLIGVEFVDGTGVPIGGKRYHYEDAHNRYLLTGITDENGKQFATYAYDGSGRTVLSEHADGADRYGFAYPDELTRVVTDPLGTERTTSMRYQGFADGVGRSTGESQPGGAGCGPGSSTITHDAQGNIASQTDFNGQKTCHFNDAVRGLETGRISGFPGGASCPVSGDEPLRATTARRISIQWHPDLPIKTAIAEPNLITSYLYNGQRDAAGRVIECAQKATLPNGKPIAVVCRKTVQPTSDTNGDKRFSAPVAGVARVWNYTYNAEGKMLTLTGPTDARGQADTQARTYYQDTTASHTAGDLATVTNAAGEVTQYLDNSHDAMATRIRRPNGQTVSLRYGPRQRLLGITTEDSGGHTERSEYAYDAVGKLVRATAPDGSFISYAYDAAHRLTELSDSAGNRMYFELDGMGNVLRQEVSGPGGDLAWKASRSFDALNRMEREQGSQDVSGTSYQYDRNGNLTGLVDPLGRITTRQYDSFDRVVRDVLPAPAQGSPSPSIGYGYNHQDQLLSVSDPRGLVTRYTVDGFGQPVGLASPDTGTSASTFDGAGNLASTRDARGVLTAYGYDAARRVIQNGSSSYAYGAPGTGATGRLTAMRDDSGQTTYAYDGFGRLLTKTQSVGPGTAARRFTLGYAYGTSGASTGHVTSLTYPSGNRIDIAYGADGHAKALSLFGAATTTSLTLLADIAYRPFGAVSGWTWGNSTPASPNTYARRFDLDGRIVSYPLGHPGSNGVIRILHYDAAGRITASTHAGNPKASALDQRYNYDGLDRLTGFDSASASQAFSYDANGNRTQARFGATSYANTISATSNRLSATSGPAPAKNNAYDAAGNLTGDGTIKYTYGASGRLDSASAGGIVTGYRYNGLGQRVAKTGPAGPLAHYVYDEQGHLIGEYDASGALIQETVYLDDLPVAVIKLPVARSSPVTGVYYVYADHLQTPRVITRATDNKMVWRWDAADPFGLYQPDENPSGLGAFTYNPRFPGQLFDKETNNHYNYFRDYDPQTGRYLQSDPIGISGGINSYAYVGENPLSFTDPFGLKPGDDFSTPEKAAKDAIEYINPRSICENREYGGYVYKNWSWGLNGPPTYTYDEPTKFGPFSGIMPAKPTFHSTYSAYHTHAAYDPTIGRGNNIFSKNDKKMGDQMKVPTYLGTPSLEIKRYTPDPSKNGNGVESTVGFTKACGCMN